MNFFRSFLLRVFVSSCEKNQGLTQSHKATKKNASIALAVLLSVLTANGAAADSSMPAAPYANTQLPDPAQEKAAQDLMLSVRCLVCEGQSIADSNAEMAADMRSMIRKRIAAGEQPEAIRSWLIERYGSWVSYKPVFDMSTAPLWLAPLALLVIGLVLARGRFRTRRR
jgi:cytochrome c-type biogenesis protein CcmH